MNSAMPTAMGTAMTIAMIELTTVPNSSTAMPKTGGSPAGFLSMVVRKLPSFFEMASVAR
jgi:hypothetical protein